MYRLFQQNTNLEPKFEHCSYIIDDSYLTYYALIINTGFQG